MKKIKNESLLKDKNFKYVNYARWLCLIFIVMFIGFIFTRMRILQISYPDLIRENPIFTAGFIVCLINLFLWWQTRTMILDLRKNIHVHYYRLLLCISVFVEFLLFNYPAAALFAFGLYKNFKWKNQPLRLSFEQLKKEGMLSKFLWNMIVIVLSLFMVLWFIASFS